MGAPIKEESTNYSAGFTAELGDIATLTLDFYRIEVDDRIYCTGDIDADGNPAISETISFYTNASDYEWSDDVTTSAILAANINDFEVTGQSLISGIQPVSDALVEDIENNYPRFRATLTMNTQFGQSWNFMARANYYGSYFDERGTIDVT